MQDQNEYRIMDQAPPMPLSMGVDKASIIEKINPDEIVEVIRNKLMGKQYNQRSGEWVDNPVLKDNAISELGAWEMSNLILSITNTNTSLSKLDDKTIRLRAYGITETAVMMMLANWREYKITNRSQIRYVAEILFDLAFITLKMADAEGIRKMIMGMYSETKNISESSREEKKRKWFRR